MATATPAEPLAISIPRIDVQQMQIRLQEASPLISHAWSRKAKQQMLDKQMKKAKTAKEAKDPFMDYVESLYWLTPRPPKPTESDIDNATFGFPTVAFKNAAVSACRFSDGIKMTISRGAFHVVGEFVTITGRPKMREDMVQIGMGTADLRYRAEFSPWSVELTISYNASALSPEQIVNLFNLAGFGVGVGEWRPEKNGSFGRFTVA